MAERAREASRRGRDCGKIPDIADIERREACRFDLALFGKTYAAGALGMPFSRDHHEVIERIQDAALHGALYALGMSRGSGKTTWSRIGCLWALSYSHRRYLFLIGASEPKAIKNLQALKQFVRFGETFAEDFPEIVFPVRALGGVAQRAGGQLCLERPTLIRWDADEIVLPTVPPPDNWPRDRWALRADGMVPTSGSCVSVSGLTGEGIRGSLMTTDTGEQIRPDLILLDDPQTRESAKSPSQNATRIELVSGDVLGMAGPGKTISAVMLCTPIFPGDMADVMLDRKEHPLWRGDRRPMMRSMPTNMAAWDRYFPIYSECAQKDPPNYTAANEHYEANRDELDAGAESAWPENFLPTEVSAIQSAMHLYFRDPRAFASERQLQPLAIFDPSADVPGLTVDGVLERVNHHERGLVPTWATTLTAAIDVHDNLLYYCVSAWGDGFAGSVVDYGVWPGQSRTYFALRDAAPTLTTATRIGVIDAAIRSGLDAVSKSILSREWRQQGGGALRVTQCLVDAGYKPEVVYRFCRETENAAILLAGKGVGIGAAKAPISDWRRLPGERRQRSPAPAWTIRAAAGRGRQCLFDANFWKSFVADRLLTPLGERSAMGIFGPSDHRLFADHATAEKRERVQHPASGRTVDEWQALPGRDNHWFDTLVSTAVGASIQGVTLEGAAAPTVARQAPPAPVDVAKEQAERKAAFQSRGESPIMAELRARRAAFEARRRMG